ncbi:hypothetical protein EOPP23_13395 [Endozoicomonas sp. OPT23]|uniref:hypothetical protein n=1 Tax=Endozoicomonas sp. OPT23 TaxID=2072845 RepID=UPI00129B6B25|nr:hypothetical protein [Endozoicomonas sp. OPT23]MRI33985.1 hypothetical protein [Endozoicomonas sp. OPT23]
MLKLSFRFLAKGCLLTALALPAFADNNESKECDWDIRTCVLFGIDRAVENVLDQTEHNQNYVRSRKYNEFSLYRESKGPQKMLFLGHVKDNDKEKVLAELEGISKQAIGWSNLSGWAVRPGLVDFASDYFKIMKKDFSRALLEEFITLVALMQHHGKSIAMNADGEPRFFESVNGGPLYSESTVVVMSADESGYSFSRYWTSMHWMTHVSQNPEIEEARQRYWREGNPYPEFSSDIAVMYDNGGFTESMSSRSFHQDGHYLFLDGKPGHWSVNFRSSDRREFDQDVVNNRRLETRTYSFE